MKQAVVAVGFCVGLGTILGLQAVFVRENPDLEEAAHVNMVIHFRVPHAGSFGWDGWVVRRRVHR